MRNRESIRIRVRRRRAAFTLLELMIVLAILAVIVGLVLPNLLGAQKKAMVRNAKIQVHSVEEAAEHYAADHDGEWPQSIDLLISSPGGNDPKWKGPYLKGGKNPADPWLNPIQYTYPGSHNGDGPDIWSMGPDKQSGTADDVSNWSSTT